MTGMHSARHRLPNRRRSFAADLKHNGIEYVVTIGLDAAGAPAEIFIDSTKPGSTISHLGQDVAVLISLAVQYGVPVDVMQSAMGRDHEGRAHSIAGAALDHLAKSQVSG